MLVIEARRLDSGVDEEGVRSLRVDGRVIVHNRTLKSVISDASRQQAFSSYLFDPRFMGASVALNPSLFPDHLLGCPPEEIKIIKQDTDVEGIVCTQIALGAQAEIWVSNSKGFPIVQYADKINRRTLVSKYAASDAIPESIVEYSIKEDGKRAIDRKFIITRETESPAVGSFSLSSLDIPIGTLVTDVEIHEVMGKWGGTKIKPINYSDEKPSKPIVIEKRKSSITFWFLGVSVFALFVGWLWLRKN